MAFDYQLEDTVFLPFTTRAFATGIPTVLAGTPAIDIYEDATATPIITGETLVVSLNSVVGFNMITVTATAATGFNVGGHYTAIIQAGTVGGVSVVGEVVGEFTIDASAAAVDLANGTDGLTALKTGIDAIPTTAMRGTDSALLASSAPTNFGDLNIIASLGTVKLQAVTHTSAVIPTVSTLTGHTAQTGDNFARLGAPASTSVSADIADIDSRTLTATNFAKISASVSTNVEGVAEAGTLSVTQMTTDLSEVTDDHFIGRTVIWTSGVLLNQASDITDYQGSNGLLTRASSKFAMFAHAIRSTTPVMVRSRKMGVLASRRNELCPRAPPASVICLAWNRSRVCALMPSWRGASTSSRMAV